MFVYFVSHIPTTMLMDAVPLYPSFMKTLIQPLLDFQGKPYAGCLSERERKTRHGR